MTDPRGAYDQEHAHGGMSKWAYADDPKRLAFTLARYKHVAKMLEGAQTVLEVGCADGFGSRIVAQHVGRLTAIDTDPRSIVEAKRNQPPGWPITFECGSVDEFVSAKPGRGNPSFDAVYCLDVLEHIKPDYEFLSKLSAVAPVAVIGTPSLESQSYASKLSREGHVNCYSGAALRERLGEIWDHVFMFTMHDETLGTSYLPMAHYLLALCVRGAR